MPRGNPDPDRRSREERDALIMQYFYLPLHVAKKMAARYESVRQLGIEDAAQWGFVGLTRAAAIWDETRGAKFVTYAYSAVHNSIYRAATTMNLVYVPAGALRKGTKPLNWRRPDDVKTGDHPPGFVAETEPQARPEYDPAAHDMAERALRMGSRTERAILRNLAEGKTGREVGRKMNPPISYQRVFQIRDEALDKIRRRLRDAKVEWE